VCRSCGSSVDAAARARALNAGGKEGRFSSCTSEGQRSRSTSRQNSR
jgi:hypothetical protein